MNICYVPVGAKTHNDVLNLNECMQVAIRYARRNKTAIESKTQSLKGVKICTQCQKVNKYFEVHHIKPMWVYALELVLTNRPQNRRELADLAIELQRGKKTILECHNKNNLLPLCSSCHDVVGSKADNQWRLYFKRESRLFFGTRNASAIERLFVKE